MKVISRTVWILSVVSLFTDISSEMLYPVMPVYLKSIGFSIVLIGVLEGFAEATAGLSKGYFGQLSDVSAKRLPFVRIGYFLSALSKPMMAVFTWPLWVFSARTLDRLGKGVRTGARDALLAGEGHAKSRGAIFGFHRAMDTFGAAIGPVLALLFLHFNPGSYRTLFYVAFIPAIAGVAATFFLKEKNRNLPKQQPRRSFFGFLRYIPRATPQYRKLLIGLVAFTLFNSSDVFLLLMLKYRGVSDEMLITIYIFYNLIFALFAWPAGRLADKVGLKTIFTAGLLIFVVVYAGMAFLDGQVAFFGLFFFYGLYAACTEGVSKAWISNTCLQEERATAIGTYEALRSVTTLAASSLTGLLWHYIGPGVAFATTAVAVTGVFFYFMTIPYVVSAPDSDGEDRK